jgi:hypothetical protein
VHSATVNKGVLVYLLYVALPSFGFGPKSGIAYSLFFGLHKLIPRGISFALATIVDFVNEPGSMLLR